jgi:tetratricopeptide (TPR) repeat protein
MKKIIFLTSLILLTSLTFAQTNKRVSAFNYLKDGDLDLAKTAIDKCVVHPKTIHDARAWLYYGQIYHAIAVSKDKAYMNLDEKPEIKAYDGYKKAILYNFKDESYWNLDIDNNQMDMIKFAKALMDPNTKYVDQGIVLDVIRNRYPVLSNVLVNKGLKEYQENKNYKGALELFERSLFTSTMVNKVDTQAVYFCALAAVKAKETDKAIEYYKVLSELAYGQNEVDKANNYYFLAKQYLAKNDTANYIKTIGKGIEKYPNSSSNLVVEMINFYLAKGMQKEALEYLDKGIQASPTNASLYYAKGSIYDTDSLLQDKDKAIEAYKKAVEIDTNHFDAYYNMGAIYYNKAAAKIEEANNVDPDDFKKYKAVKAEANVFFKQALPYLEKAHKINPKDMPTMQSLKLIYYRTGELEKSEAMKKEMEGK